MAFSIMTVKAFASSLASGRVTISIAFKTSRRRASLSGLTTNLNYRVSGGDSTVTETQMKGLS